MVKWTRILDNSSWKLIIRGNWGAFKCKFSNREEEKKEKRKIVIDCNLEVTE